MRPARKKAKPRTFKVWVPIWDVAEKRNTDEIRDIYYGRRKPFSWYVRATLTLDSSPSRKRPT